MYVLVIDDDTFANKLVQFVLSKEGFEVETADNPHSAISFIQDREPDIIILDITMPYMNGFELIGKLRRDGYEMPVIFLTAQDTIKAKLRGFELGAEDYITKPYNHLELVARVKVIARRIEKQERPVRTQRIRAGSFELLAGELKLLTPKRSTISLTPTEMQILRELMIDPDSIVHRDQLLSAIWNSNDDNTSNVVNVYIRRLRVKLEEDADNPKHILSVRGSGYKFVA